MDKVLVTKAVTDCNQYGTPFFHPFYQHNATSDLRPKEGFILGYNVNHTSTLQHQARISCQALASCKNTPYLKGFDLAKASNLKFEIGYYW